MDFIALILGIGFLSFFIVSLYEKYKLKNERKYWKFFSIGYFIIGISGVIGAFSPY